MRVRKRPIEVEARLFDGTMKSANEIIGWTECGAYFNEGRMGGTKLYILTLEGDMHATPGDYIIKGVEGEFYPCKPDIFWKTYEVIDDLI